jgi:hypothetical protein
MYVLLYFLLITLFVLLIYKVSLDKTKPIQTKLGESVNKNVSNTK